MAPTRTDLLESRRRLRSRLIAAFSARREVREIHVFGREVEGEVDEYSDIDMVICSDDLPATGRNCRAALSAVSPILGAYVIRCDEDELVEMVMLHEKHFGWRDEIRYGLRAQEYKALWKALTADERAALERIMPMDGRPSVIDDALIALDLFLGVCRQRSSSTGEPVDLAFAAHVRMFLESEFGRHAAQTPSTNDSTPALASVGGDDTETRRQASG